MNLQCIPRMPKRQARKTFSLPVVSRSSLHSKSVMCSPLTLIHAHQAERVHRPWQKYTGLRIKPPGTDQRAVPGARWCARRQAQVREDADDDSRIFDGGDDLQAPATVRAVFDVDVKDPFEQTRPTQARQHARRVFCSMIACTVRPRHDRSTRQLNGRYGHAAEVKGLHILTAAFEDGADRRTLSFILR